MSRATYVWREGIGIIEKHLASDPHERSQAFGVITDTMAIAAAHPCTGKMMDSKSAFRRVTREHGCIEVGTETASPGKPYSPSQHEIESAVARCWRD